MFEEFVAIALLAESFVIGFTELLKTWIKNDKLYPAISVALGLVFGMAFIIATRMPATSGEWIFSVLASLSLGLAGTGMYRAGKSIFRGNKE